MKAMMTGFAAIVVISFAAHFGLQQAGFSAQDRNSSSAVRLE